MNPNQNILVTTLPAGHSEAPTGKVIVKDFETPDENGDPTVTEHTPDEWAALQQ